MQKNNLEIDWREVPRAEMFDRVISAVDASYGEAQENGEQNWIRYCENVLFPFLENEQEKSATPEEVITDLVEETGISEEEARLRLRDDDLWTLEGYARFDEDLTGEYGVRCWEQAAILAQSLADGISNGPTTIEANPAITQLCWDASTRAHEALRRAR